jgi:hypothetical protein
MRNAPTGADPYVAAAGVQLTADGPPTLGSRNDQADPMQPRGSAVEALGTTARSRLVKGERT